MSDKFAPAVAELAEAIAAGDEIQLVLNEIAEAHELKPEALRNRAELAYGDLSAYRDKVARREAESEPVRNYRRALHLSRMYHGGESMRAQITQEEFAFMNTYKRSDPEQFERALQEGTRLKYAGQGLKLEELEPPKMRRR